MNCASISVDVLRVLGWDIPARGPASRLVAALGFPWFAVQGAVDRQGPRRLRLPQRGPDAAHARRGVRGRGREPAGARERRTPRAARRRARAAARPRRARRSRSSASRSFRRAASSATRRRSRRGSIHARVPAEPGMAQIVPVPPRPVPGRAARPGPAARRAAVVRLRRDRSGDCCSSSASRSTSTAGGSAGASGPRGRRSESRRRHRKRNHEPSSAPVSPVAVRAHREPIRGERGETDDGQRVQRERAPGIDREDERHARAARSPGR